MLYLKNYQIRSNSSINTDMVDISPHTWNKHNPDELKALDATIA